MAEVTVPQIIAPIEPIKSPLALDEASMNVSSAICHRRRYPARTDVFRPGDPANTLYYVISGSLSIITEEPDGRELVLGYINQGEFIGEMGLFFKTDKREVVLRTRTPCELAEISYERLHELFSGALAKECSENPVRDRRAAIQAPAGHQPESQPPGLPGRRQPHPAHPARPVPGAGCADRIRKAPRYGFHARNWRASSAARGKWPGAC